MKRMMLSWILNYGFLGAVSAYALTFEFKGRDPVHTQKEEP